MDQTMIVSEDVPDATERPDDVIVVGTLLEAITRLERRPIRTVVLAGSYAGNEELAAFLAADYPAIRVERED